jgi:teichoic acid transport system ATP-binding protein
MKKIRENGTTILFVSHSTEQIRRFCTKGIWLDKGSIISIGNANDIVNAYENSLHLEVDNQAISNLEMAKSASIENIDSTDLMDSNQIGYIVSVNCDHKELTTFETLSVSVTYRITAETVTNFLLGVALYDRDRKYIFGPNTYLDKIEDIPNMLGEHTIIYKIPRIPLLTGTYFVDVGIFSEKGLVYIDYKTSADSFTMKNDYFTEGLVHLEHEWSVVKG